MKRPSTAKEVWHLDHTLRKTQFKLVTRPFRLVRSIAAGVITDTSNYFNSCLSSETLWGER